MSLESKLHVGDQIKISSGSQWNIFQVTKVGPDYVMIIDKINPNAGISILTPDPVHQWMVKGSNAIYQFEVLSQPIELQLKITDLTHSEPVIIPSKRNNEPPLTIPVDKLAPAYRPIIEKSVLDPRDPNILGTPLFFDGMDWPTYDGSPMSFYAQFFDPNPDSPFGDNFIQLFVANLELEGMGEKAVIVRTIDLPLYQEGNPISPPQINDPNSDINQRLRSGSMTGKIIGWKKIDTIFRSDIEGPDGKGADFDAYNIGPFNIGDEGELEYLLQIGGVGPTFQGIDYREYNVYFNGIYNGEWGDGGALNVDIQGHTFGDMG